MASRQNLLRMPWNYSLNKYDLALCCSLSDLTRVLSRKMYVYNLTFVQVLEISSLTMKDLEAKPHLRQSLEHLSDGIRLSTRQLCDLLAWKIKNLTYSLWLTADETSLETFQEKIAGLLEVLLRIIVFWDQQLIKSFQNSIIYLKEPLYNMRNTQFLHEILSLYKVRLSYLVITFEMIHTEIFFFIIYRSSSCGLEASLKNYLTVFMICLIINCKMSFGSILNAPVSW